MTVQRSPNGTVSETDDPAGMTTRVVVSPWRTTQVSPALEAVFDPPSGMAEQEVEAAALQRVFSAMFNFAMESAR